MKIIGMSGRVSSLLIAGIVLAQFSPIFAAGRSEGQRAAIQGSRVPGMAVPDTASKRDRHQPSIDVTFTKWRTAGVAASPGVPARHLFKGVVGGDLGDGSFVGEVLDRQVSTPCTSTTLDPPCSATVPTITGSIIALQAIYEVQVGEHSFTALIDGGTDGATGAALLNGVILAGWRAGAKVHVEFATIPGAIGCVNKGGPAGATCFQGTIRVGHAPRD